MALLFVVGTPGTGLAATLKSIDQDGLNLRSGPGTTYQVVSTLAADQSVKVLDAKDGWYKVRTESGAEAWAAGWVSRVSYEDEEVYAVVDTDVLNFRKEPSMSGQVLAVLKTGERLRLMEVVGEWWRVRRSSGVDGWVNGKFMKREAQQPGTQQPGAQQPGTQQPGTQQPGTQQPVTPPPAKPPVVETPAPAAPSWAVPVLAALPPAPSVRPTGAKQVVASAAATVYLGRSTVAFDPVDKVKPGEKLKFLDAAEGWVKVETPRGLKGWIPGTAVAVTEGKLAYQLKEGAWSLSYAPVAPGAPAPAAPPTAPGVTAKEQRVVRDADGLNLRQTASESGKKVAVLPQGEILEVLDREVPWLWVKTASGRIGWVHGAYTDPYGTPPPAAPAPAPKPTLTATLTTPTPGALQLEITSADKPLAEPRPDGNTLLIPVITGETATAAIPVGSGGARELALTPTGVALSLDAMPSLQILEKSPSRMVVLLRPAVAGVTVKALSDRTVYNFQVSGPMLPRTRAAGANVVVEFPGAIDQVGSKLPAGVKLEPTAKGLQATVASRQPYSLKRTDGGFELHLYQPGLTGKTIVLDPGHGGPDGGAVNNSLGIREANINLQISLRLRALLAAKGATVLMSRISDVRSVPAAILAAGPQDDLTHVDLGYRSRIANELKADAFISVHNNCCSGSGTETYYTSGILNGERSGTLARLIQQELPKGLGSTNRGAMDDLMYVTRTADGPAVLVEVGFLSHPVEGAKLKTSAYQEQAAQSLVKALDRFFAERTE
ncbi:MAG: putative N-acetylmuramoyl-L-alanine amidase [Symbiobacteriaceae bacterium]|jgi:N-acetylmuramoyl-L-alanine amidase|nr:putative N-acetylmuramoyl-L-alanine amidase [Symbiobacteriaceae bacterium]